MTGRSLHQVKELVLELQRISVEFVVRAEDRGKDFALTEAAEGVGTILSLWRMIEVASLDGAPPELLKKLQAVAQADKELLIKLHEWDPKQDPGYGKRDALLRELDNRVSYHFERSLPWFYFGRMNETKWAESVKGRLESQAEEILGRLQGELSQVENVRSEVNEIRSDVEQAAGLMGVEAHATAFAKVAGEHDRAAKKWLVTSFVLAAVTALMAALWFYGNLGRVPQDLSDAVHYGIGKVFFFGALSFALYLSSRNYLVNRHNAIVNQHRQNALLTYRAILDDVVEDRHYREKVLTFAASCIFSPQPSGYSRDESPTVTLQPMIDLISKQGQ